MPKSSRTIPPIYFNHIVCEGESEVFYIDNLVQFFTDKGFNPKYSLKAYPPDIKNGKKQTTPYALLKKAKLLPKTCINFDRMDTISILLDEDRFNKGEFDKNQFIKDCNKAGITPIFQSNNYEDFLVCHLDQQKLEKWIRIVSEYPEGMSGKEIEIRILEVIPKYKKGYIPFNFRQIIFTEEGLKLAIERCSNSEIAFNSGFATILKTFLP